MQAFQQTFSYLKHFPAASLFDKLQFHILLPEVQGAGFLHYPRLLGNGANWHAFAYLACSK